MDTPSGTVTPYRERRPDATVYHDNRACPVGEALARFDRIAGTRGLPRCETCTALRSAAVHATV